MSNSQIVSVETNDKGTSKLGFYQQAESQQVFFNVGRGVDTLFLTFEVLRKLLNAIELAQKHLASRGAE